MKHEGKAGRAGRKIIFASLLLALAAAGLVWAVCGSGGGGKAFACVVAFLWGVFAVFTLNFFRDPTARPADEAGVLLSPAHGTVDVIDETVETEVMGGRCRRVSIFLSVFDVHVQNAPLTGKVISARHTPGKFLNAMNADSALHNENLLLGFELEESPGVRIGVRLIAGLIARRIVPWIAVNERVIRGERISLVQFGSRCDVYFPLEYKVRTALGSKVRGGETVLASRNH